MTELTREGLLTWAEERVKKRPTYRDQVGYDRGSHQPVRADQPNTVARELAGILQAHVARELADYDLRDALGLLRDWAWRGTRGYAAYTTEEALEEIFTEVLDSYEFEGLEDLLTEFELDEED
jgi:hypothetical protein